MRVRKLSTGYAGLRPRESYPQVMRVRAGSESYPQVSQVQKLSTGERVQGAGERVQGVQGVLVWQPETIFHHPLNSS